jgi:hypothetical protein
MKNVPNGKTAFSIAVAFALLGLPGAASAHQPGYTDSFMLETCGGFASAGRNPFFILEPGHRSTLSGLEDGVEVRVTITVLNQTKTVNGVSARVVEERETHDGELAEVSRNYFAICKRSNSVVYFGEDVDIYEGGAVVGHDGSWRAGVNGAMAGIIMPGTVLLGARYHQEVAPGVALDRAEIVSLSDVVETPAGKFQKCLKTVETTPLEPGQGFKRYAPGIGLVQDGVLKLSAEQE